MNSKDSVNEIDGGYERMIEALHGLDIEHLHDLYIRRREGFLKNVRDDSHKELSTRLLYAVISTDVCMEVYQEFLVAMTQRFENLIDEAKQEMADHQDAISEMLGKSRELSREAHSEGEAGLQEAYRSSIDTRIALYQQMFESRQDLAVFQSSTRALSTFIFTLSGMSTHGSLERLLGITDLTLVGDVLVLVMQTLVGFIPCGVGTLSSSAWELYQILDRKAKQYKRAGDLLTQLDNFSDAAFQWCITTQMLIELIEGRLATDNRDPDELESIVGEQEIERITKIVLARIENSVNECSAPPS